jgi:manganese/zinc/iron transport system substrate-binding protein
MLNLTDFKQILLLRLLTNMYAKYKLSIILIITILLGNSTYTTYATTKCRIVTTTSIIGDAIQHIVKDSAQVIKLMGPGVDPHAYKATAKNIQDLSHADIIFYNGLHLEGKMADILVKFSKRKPVFAASNGIDSSQYVGDFKFADGLDPHIWFDVSLWKQAVQYMSKCLQKIDTASASYYQENTEKYLEQLDELHEKIQKYIHEIPKNQRVLITAHDAFTYFGRAYDIEVKGLQGISTVGECGLRDITSLVEFIIKRNIKAIFPENSVPGKPLRAVVEGCKKRGHDVILGKELYSDALGEENTWEGTYIGMVSTNVQTIVDALK